MAGGVAFRAKGEAHGRREGTLLGAGADSISNRDSVGRDAGYKLVISILVFFIDIPNIYSIKEKRQVVKSVKDRLQHKFRISVAEVDYQDTLRTAQIGAAVVSNSRQFGESVLQKALNFVEDMVPGRIRDTSIFSEFYGPEGGGEGAARDFQVD